MIIKNEILEVTVKPEGAELTSVKGYNHEYLWTADSKFWGRHAPVLFPFVGSLIDKTFTVDGAVYHSDQHGFARDEVFTVLEEGSDYVTYRLVSNEQTLTRYPYHFNFDITYRLKDHGLTVTYKVVNTGDDAMYYSVGGHPGFNIGDINDYTINIDGRYDSYDLVGSFINQKHEDQTGNIICSKEFFEPGAFIYQPHGAHVIELLKNEQPYVTMEYDDFKLMGIWTPEGMDAPFICLEPWNGIADFNNRANNDIVLKDFIEVLAPGEQSISSYTIKFFEEK